MRDLRDHEIPREIIQEREIEQTHDRVAPEGEYQVTEGLENYGFPRQGTPEEDDNEVLDQEKENLDNARIYDNNTVVIHLKQGEEHEHDRSQPAKYWTWKKLIAVGNPAWRPRGCG